MYWFSYEPFHSTTGAPSWNHWPHSQRRKTFLHSVDPAAVQNLCWQWQSYGGSIKIGESNNLGCKKIVQMCGWSGKPFSTGVGKCPYMTSTNILGIKRDGSKWGAVSSMKPSNMFEVMLKKAHHFDKYPLSATNTWHVLTLVQCQISHTPTSNFQRSRHIDVCVDPM